MSDEKIDHAAEAVKFINQNVWREAGALDEHIPSLIARAQVHATLALVEQQRIANLIAILCHDDGLVLNGDTNVFNGARWAETRAEIRKGLGL